MQTSGILVERYRVSPRSNFSAKNKSPRRERLLEYLEYLWGHSVYRNIAPSASNGDAQVRDLGIALYNAKGNHRHCTSTYGWHIAESRNFLLRTRNKFHVISISTVLFPDLHTGGGTCLYFCYSAHLSSARTCTAYVLVFPSTRREIRMSCLTKRWEGECMCNQDGGYYTHSLLLLPPYIGGGMYTGVKKWNSYQLYLHLDCKDLVPRSFTFLYVLSPFKVASR